MLHFFSKFPFKKVDGLEYSQEYVDIAERNMRKLHIIQKKGGGVDIFHGNATTYQSYDDYNYFYLFNPFNEKIMRPFLENVKTSISRRPRKIRLIYLNPRQHQIMLEAGLKLEEEIHTFGLSKCFVYSYWNTEA